MESKAASFIPTKSDFEHGGWTLTTFANEAALKLKTSGQLRGSVERWNPYNHLDYACHNDETVDQFLIRVPPRTTYENLGNAWIWIANTFHRQPKNQSAVLEEGPSDQHGKHQLVIRGKELLANLVSEVNKLEVEFKGRPATKFSRATNEVVKYIEKQIRDAARTYNVKGGKVISRPIL